MNFFVEKADYLDVVYELVVQQKVSEAR